MNQKLLSGLLIVTCLTTSGCSYLQPEPYPVLMPAETPRTHVGDIVLPPYPAQPQGADRTNEAMYKWRKELEVWGCSNAASTQILVERITDDNDTVILPEECKQTPRK